MINGQRILGVIPARGGSKGIPRKNLTMFGGKPLIAWTIEAGLHSRYIDRLILSSEDPEIITVAATWGCEVPFVRPAELSRDETPGIEPVIHAIQTLKTTYDYVILLQPTSPLRTTEDIDNCIYYCIQENAPSCVSVCAAQSSPYWMYILNQQKRLIPLMPEEHSITRKQDLPPVYVLNGAIYMAFIPNLMQERSFINRQTIAYTMPVERSLDIDSEVDLLYGSFLLSSTGPPCP